MSGGKIRADSLLILSLVIIALALALGAESARAQSVQVISLHSGESISYTGHAGANSAIAVTISSSTSVPVSGGEYNRQIGPITVPSCSVIITVNNVQTINFGGSQYVEALGVGVWTPEVTKSLSLPTANAGAYSYIASAGRYNVRVFGTAASGASSVTADISISWQVPVDGTGEYTAAIGTANLPAGVYTVTAGGVLVARVYLDTPAPQTFTLSMDKGWNIISLPIIPEDSSIASIFSNDQLNNINVIWDYNGGQWLYFTRKAGYTSQFSTLSVNKGYYVYCKTPMSVQIVGSAGPGVIPYSSLSKGWNLIGYPTTSTTDIASTYGNAYVIWKIESSNWYYYTTKPGLTSQFFTLTPGKGYWINKRQ
ncbi:MAG: hypothetical protein WBZ29_11200 [Methanocella sp.]